MRETKMQAWTDEGMIEVQRITFAGSVFYVTSTDDDGYEFMIEPKQLRRFTGVKDADGREIYENDIVKPTVNPSFSTFDRTKIPGVVKFFEGYFGIEEAPLPEFNRSASYPLTKKCRIVGNIYENPELMEKNVYRSKD